MKYNKNDFVLVPNRSQLIGMPPLEQVVFFWLCSHADGNNQSFPSRKVLAYECGISIRTLDRCLAVLEEKGMLVRQPRFNNNEQSTNLYEVVIFAEGGVTNAGGSDTDARGSVRNNTQNYNHLTKTSELITTNVVGKPKASDEISKKYYQVIKLYSLPTRNHANVKKAITKLRAEATEQEIVVYLNFLLDRYPSLKFEHRPELSEALDIHAKRMQIINAVKRLANKQATPAKGFTLG